MVQQLCTEHAENPEVAEFIAPLQKHVDQWQQLTMEVVDKASRDPEEIGAAAYDYLMYSGYVALAYWWARSVAVSEAGSSSHAFKAGKRETAKFYFARILPRTLTHAAAIRSGSASLMTLDAEQFDA